ncbi:MAG: hypothetical protein ACREMZ_01660 [Gemmatimonadales bacterium]
MKTLFAALLVVVLGGGMPVQAQEQGAVITARIGAQSLDGVLCPGVCSVG